MIDFRAVFLKSFHSGAFFFQISRMMQLKSESDQKERDLFEENKAVNLRMQSKNEEFTKQSVNFEQFKSEHQILKTERDKLMQDIAKMSQMEATIQMNVQIQSAELQKRQVWVGSN
jgi:hypothetical protein